MTDTDPARSSRPVHLYDNLVFRALRLGVVCEPRILKAIEACIMYQIRFLRRYLVPRYLHVYCASRKIPNIRHSSVATAGEVVGM